VASSSKKEWPTRGGQEQGIKVEPVDETMGGHSFYGQNIAGGVPHTSLSPTHSETEPASDPDSSHTGRFTADFAKPNKQSLPTHATLPVGGVAQSQSSTARLEIIPHTFPVAHHKFLIPDSHIEPWRHPAFIPLPAYVYQSLYQIDSVEMPKRPDFESSLMHLQRNMMEAIKETACLSVDKYIKLARALQTGDVSHLSDRLHSWTVIHRLCAGSDKYSAILVPRDSVFEMDAQTAAGHRRRFISDLLNDNTDEDSLQVFLKKSSTAIV
jgi:hypothetical protein